jgi:hypothetical protein
MVKDLRAALAGWLRNTTGRRKTYEAPAQPGLVEPGARLTILSSRRYGRRRRRRALPSGPRRRTSAIVVADRDVV